MSRPAQIGIDRLPARRMSEQPREAMNCKSCRKRKIKCNRLRPACEACQIFACPCVYDAVPKKRGPKTDVLEALLKRVDGLEKRLKSEGKDDGAGAPVSAVKEAILEAVRNGLSEETSRDRSSSAAAQNMSATTSTSSTPTSTKREAKLPSPPTSHPLFSNSNYSDILLDTYFDRIHGKPYHILDEASTRQRLLSNQLPDYLGFAVYAVSARYASNYGGYDAAVRNGHDYARRARAGLDVDEPSIEGLQTLLLLSQAMFQEGLGKKAYTYLSSAVAMALALNLHREIPATVRVSAAEREGRRRLFWSCYLLDRFSACGSKRPSLISDECIVLRLPTGTLQSMAMVGEGEYFTSGSNLHYMAAPGNPGQGSTGMLVGIVRILGNTNRYLAAGGVKGDSHFPWHSHSSLSKIRGDLDIWASDTQDIFSSLEALFGQPDSIILVLGKLIYHLIHCLIYRPFLPVDLAELSRSSQHQSWQIEATNLCFLHANAIAELVEIGKTSSIIDWPAFVSYCVCTAGTIHVHGAHYQGRNGEVFSTSAEFLSRELQQLTELRFIWSGIQHQKDTLQTLYGAHSELVKSLATNPIRFSPVFQMEDFFDRYPGYYFDGAHITFNDNLADEALSSQNKPYQSTRTQVYSDHNVYQYPQAVPAPSTPLDQQPRKRRATGPPGTQPSGLVPATFDGVPSTDTYQSPYTNSTPQHQTYSHYNPGLAPATPATPSFTFSADMDGVHTNNHHHNNGETDTALKDAQHQQQGNGHVDRDHHDRYDPMLSMPAHFDQDGREGGDADTDGVTPRPMTAVNTLTPQSASLASSSMNGGAAGQQPEDPDPFLSLLEQLAENEQSRGGPSELDFFLSGG